MQLYTAKKGPQIKNWFYKWFALYILKQTVYSLHQNVDSLYQNVGGKSIVDFTNDSTTRNLLYKVYHCSAALQNVLYVFPVLQSLLLIVLTFSYTVDFSRRVYLVPSRTKYVWLARLTDCSMLPEKLFVLENYNNDLINYLSVPDTHTEPIVAFPVLNNFPSPMFFPQLTWQVTYHCVTKMFHSTHGGVNVVRATVPSCRTRTHRPLSWQLFFICVSQFSQVRGC